MKSRSRFAVGCCLFALTASLGWAQPKPAAPSNRLKARLGAKTVAILQAPTKVEVFRLDPQYAGKMDEKHFLAHPIKATGKEQGTEFGSRLGALLLQDEAWFNPDKFMLDHRVVGYRIWKEKEAVEVVYDITTRVSARLLGNKGKPTDGNCDPIHTAFAELAAEAFPDDKELKAVVGRIKGK